MATFKHISSKNADYGAAEQYLTFEHDEFTMKPTRGENGRLIPRDDYRISSLNCGGEDFAIACMRSNLNYGKNQRKEDVKSHHYDDKYSELNHKLEKCEEERLLFSENALSQKNIANRMKTIREKLKNAEIFDEFDRLVFESIVEKVIVGENAEDGTIDPYKLA